MLRKTSSKATGMLFPAVPSTGFVTGGSEAAAGGWEVRAGGMLVQKRNSDQNTAQIPQIRVRVKYGPYCHEVNISPHSSFGELKKMLAGQTGLHPQDQKLIYREKERNSREFLDVAGVGDGSKIVLVEDELSRDRRVLEESRRNVKHGSSKAIAQIGIQVEKLGKQVTNLELEINGGNKVAETVLLSLIELLMRQLLKLDEIVADGDAKLQRREQVRRAQKFLETLDVLKTKNAARNQFEALLLQQQKQKHSSTGQTPKPTQKHQHQHQQRNSISIW